MAEVSLEEGEPHPMAFDARDWVAKKLAEPKVLFLVQESLASSALADNRAATIMGSTLERLIKSEPVSDRYVLGLAWFLKKLAAAAKEDLRSKEKFLGGENDDT